MRGLLDLLMEAQGQAQSISQYLSRIRVGSSTLADSWFRIQEEITDFWKEKSKSLACFREEDLARLRDFLEEHPEYGRLSADEKITIESLMHQGDLSLDDLVDLIRTQLLNRVKQLGVVRDAR